MARTIPRMGDAVNAMSIWRISWSEMGNSNHESLAFEWLFVYNVGDFTHHCGGRVFTRAHTDVLWDRWYKEVFIERLRTTDLAIRLHVNGVSLHDKERIWNINETF